MDIKPSRSVYALNLMPYARLPLFKYGGCDNTQWISISESYVAQSSEAMSRNFELRVIMGIMTGLLGRCWAQGE